MAAVAMAESLGDPEHLIRATLNLGLICNTAGDYRQAAVQLARALADMGRFDDATAAIEEAIRIAESLQHATTLLSARMDLGHVLICRGDWIGAIPTLETCLDAFRCAGMAGFGSGAAGMLGYARAMAAHPEEGISLIREALEHAAHGRRTREALFTTYVSEALLVARQMDEAAAVAGRALTLSLERCERGTEARARYVLGEIAAMDVDGDRSVAERHHRRALALAGELGMRPLVAQCHLAFAALGRQRSEPRTRRQHLASASAMFRELGMLFWSERAEAEAREG